MSGFATIVSGKGDLSSTLTAALAIEKEAPTALGVIVVGDAQVSGSFSVPEGVSLTCAGRLLQMNGAADTILVHGGGQLGTIVVAPGPGVTPVVGAAAVVADGYHNNIDKIVSDGGFTGLRTGAFNTLRVGSVEIAQCVGNGIDILPAPGVTAAVLEIGGGSIRSCKGIGFNLNGAVASVLVQLGVSECAQGGAYINGAKIQTDLTIGGDSNQLFHLCIESAENCALHAPHLASTGGGPDLLLHDTARCDGGVIGTVGSPSGDALYATGTVIKDDPQRCVQFVKGFLGGKPVL